MLVLQLILSFLLVLRAEDGHGILYDDPDEPAPAPVPKKAPTTDGDLNIDQDL